MHTNLYNDIPNSKIKYSDYLQELVECRKANTKITGKVFTMRNGVEYPEDKLEDIRFSSLKGLELVSNLSSLTGGFTNKNIVSDSTRYTYNGEIPKDSLYMLECMNLNKDKMRCVYEISFEHALDYVLSLMVGGMDIPNFRRKMDEYLKDNPVCSNYFELSEAIMNVDLEKMYQFNMDIFLGKDKKLDLKLFKLYSEVNMNEIHLISFFKELYDTAEDEFTKVFYGYTIVKGKSFIYNYVAKSRYAFKGIGITNTEPTTELLELQYGYKLILRATENSDYLDTIWERRSL